MLKQGRHATNLATLAIIGSGSRTRKKGSYARLTELIILESDERFASASRAATTKVSVGDDDADLGFCCVRQARGKGTGRRRERNQRYTAVS